MKRRAFLATLPAFALLDGAEPPALRIRDIQLIRLSGHRMARPGANAQRQVNPIHIYPEHRPAPYKEPPPTEPRSTPASAIYVKILTEGGPEGMYGPVDAEGAVVIQRQLKSLLIGKNGLAGETLWDQMHRSNRHSRAGAYMIAISALDNALWDLRGRYFNAPVYRLLGGPTRPEVEAYGSCLGFSLEPALVMSRSADLLKQGYRHQKWFIGYGPGDGTTGLQKNVELVANLRKALGDGPEIMFDAFMGWNLDYAIRWCKAVEQYRPRWIEEAFHLDKIQSFVDLRRSTSVPVATGEHFYNRWEVSNFLRAGAISVVQADPEWCGGVSELVKICAIASTYDAQVIPHGHGLHAALHVVASQSPMTCPLVENLILKMESYHHFEKLAPHPVNGMIALPDRPGFGVELDPAKIEKQEAFV